MERKQIITGFSDQHFIVKSATAKYRTVKLLSTCKCSCDHECLGYELRKVCAHKIAAAVYCNNLHKYLKTFQKESTINLTKLTIPSSVSQRAGKKVENNVNENIIALCRRYQPFNLQLLVNYFQNLLQGDQA